MTSFILKFNENKREQNGFSLIELMIATLISVIVFGFAVTFIVSFSSASYQASAKKDVTTQGRVAMSRVLKDVSGASNIPTCNQYKTQQATLAASTDTNYFKNNPEKCDEIINGSQVISVAGGSTVCWYISDVAQNTSIIYPSKFACLFAGNSTTSTCIKSNQNDPDTLYYNECNTGSSTPIANSSSIVVNLGPHKELTSSPGRMPVREPLFSYFSYDNSPFDSVNYNKILKITMQVKLSYENGKNIGGNKDYSTYDFSQTIQLSGMKAYLETGAYGN